MSSRPYRFGEGFGRDGERGNVLFMKTSMKKLLTIVLGMGCLIWLSVASAASADHVVISEIKTTGGTGKTTDEFIELYNPTGTAVSLTGWSLVKKTASGNDYVLVADFGEKNIPANGYLLVAHPTGYDGSVVPDAVYTMSNSISDNNTVLVLDSAQNVVDEIGWGTATIGEGEAAANPSAAKSLERKAKPDSTVEFMLDGGRDYFAGNGEDSGNNKNDFIVRDVPEPQNSLSEPECVTASAPTVPVTNTNSVAPVSNTNTRGNTNTAPTNQSTVNTNTASTIVQKTYDYSKKVFINEVLPSCAGPDDACEFIELINTDDRPIHLVGWSLTDQKTTYRFPEDSVIDVGELLSIDHATSKITLNNTGDTLYLIDPGKNIVHGVTYGKAKEDISFSRTDDGSHWSWTDSITAGQANEFTENEEDDDPDSAGVSNAAGSTAEQPATDAAVSTPVVSDIAGVTASMIGRIVTVSGQVDSISGRSFYLVDESGNSLRVYVPKKPGLDTVLVKTGDSVSVTGEVSKTNAGLRIVPRTANDIVGVQTDGTEESGSVLGAEAADTSIDIPATTSDPHMVLYVIGAAVATVGGVSIYIWRSKKGRDVK